MFISYRRNDGRWAAALIHRALAARFGADDVFLDHTGIDPGEDFEQSIASKLQSCEVLLAVIGPQWTSITDARGRRCLDRPDDFVAREIGTALGRQCTVIPVLIDGALMPCRDELPEAIAALQRCNAFEISAQRVDRDVALLIEFLEQSAKPHDSLTPVIRSHVEAVRSRLDVRRTTHARDLQQNVLDFYVDARGSAEPLPASVASSAAKPLRELVMPSIEAGRPSIIIADFGMGKTWFLEHLQYELAASEDCIPVWVSLRTFRPDSTARVLDLLGALAPRRTIFQQLRDQAWAAAFGEAAAARYRDVLIDLYEKGRFVFFFDALDEMVLLSRRERDDVLAELGDLRRHTRRSPLVLTCRRTFFIDREPEKRLAEFGFDVFYLRPWLREDILSYLLKARTAGILHTDAEGVLTRMEETYDLCDLSSRAMLSAMLVDQWDELTRDAIDLPSLYERHIEKAMLGWQGRRNWQLEPHQVQQYMEEIAFLMFRLGTLSLTPAELDQYFSEQLGAANIERFSAIAESFIRDIRTNSLLQRDGDAYSFCHISIGEFLVARRLARTLVSGEADAFRIASRAAEYESVFQNFLIPMLRAQKQLGLLANVFAPAP
jgi:hypothetical protein